MKENVVNSTTDINKILKEVLSYSNNFVAVLNGITNSMSKIQIKGDFDKINKNVHRLNKSIGNYINSMSDVVNTLVTIGSNEKLKILLTAVDEKGNIVQSGGTLPLVKTVANLSTLLSKTLDGITKLSETSLGIKQFIKIKSNIIILKQSILDIFDLLDDTLGQVIEDERILNIMNKLASKPDTITKVTKNNIQKNENGKIVINPEVVREETQKGEIGLLDIILNFFSLIGKLSGLRAPNLINFKIQMMLVEVELNQVLDVLAKIAIRHGHTEYLQRLSIMTGEVVKVFDSITDIAEASNDLIKLWVMSLPIKRGINLISTIIFRVYDMLFSEKTKDKITTLTTLGEDAIADIGDVLSELSDISKTILNTGKIMMVFQAMYIPASIGLLGMKRFMNSLSRFIVDLRQFGVMTSSGVAADLEGQKSPVETMKSVIEILDGVSKTTAQLIDVSKSLIIAGMLGSMLPKQGLKDLITSIKDIMNDLPVLQDIDQPVDISNILAFLGDINKLLSELVKVSTLSLTVKPGLLVVKDVIAGISDMIQELSEKNLKALPSETLTNINEYINILNRLKSVILTISIVGLLAPILFIPLTFGILIVHYTIWGLGKVLQLLSNKVFSNNIKQSSKTLLLLSITLGVLSAVLLSTALLGAFVVEYWDIMAIGLTGVVVTMLLLVGVLWLLSLVKNVVVKGSIALLIMSFSLIFISTSLIILGKAGRQLDAIGWETFGKISAILLSYIGIISLVGLGAAFILPGAAVMIVVGMSMLIMSGSLITMATAMKKVDETVADMDESTDNMKKITHAFLDVVDDMPGLLTITAAALKMTGMMIIAASIGNMADVIVDMATLQVPTEFDKNGKPIRYSSLNPELIMQSALNIAAIAGFFVNFVGGNDQELGDGTVIKGLNIDTLQKISIGTLIKMAELNGVVSAIGGMADVIVQMASLNVPTEFDKNGKPIRYEKISKEKIIQASQNIEIITTSILDSVSRINQRQIRNARKTFKQLNRIDLSGLKEMSDILIEINKNKSTILNSTKTIKILYTKITTLFNNGKNLKKIDTKKLDLFKGYVKSLGDLKNNINKIQEKNLDPTIKLIDKANSINTDKIKSVAEMFERMAGFSKTINGNFEKLAKVLSEDLMEALGELNQYLENASNNEIRQPSQASPMFTSASVQPITMSTTPMEAIKQQPPTNAPAQALPDLSAIQSSLTRIQDTLSSFTTSGVVIKETDF